MSGTEESGQGLGNECGVGVRLRTTLWREGRGSQEAVHMESPFNSQNVPLPVPSCGGRTRQCTPHVCVQVSSSGATWSCMCSRTVGWKEPGGWRVGPKIHLHKFTCLHRARGPFIGT